MAKSVYVYSTLSTNMRYVKYTKGGGDLPFEERGVTIKGGANVADKHLLTPRGVVTEITDEEYEFLKGVDLFRTHVDNGFVTVEERKVDPEKVASDMEPRDASSPLTPGDFETTGGQAPVTNAPAPEATGAGRNSHPAKARKPRGKK